MFCSYRHPRVVGVGSDKQDKTYVHLSDSVRSLVEPRIGNRLPNRQNHRSLRIALVTHVGGLLPDSPCAVEVRQHTRAHGNRTNVQREHL